MVENDKLVATAQQVWEAQARAHAALPGALPEFFAYIGDDIEWTFPIGRYAGTHQGKESFVEFFRFACDYFPTGLTYNLEKIYPVSEDTVAIEFNDEGKNVTGNDYKASVTFYYTIQGDKLVKYVEQFRAQNK